MGWAIFAVLIIVYKVTGRKQPGKGKGGFSGGEGGGGGGGKGGKTKLIIGIIREALLFTAICSLVFAPLPFGWGTVGTVVGGFLMWALNLIGGFLSMSGTVVATVLLIAAVVVAIWDVISDRKIDKPAKNALVIMPFLGLIAVGPVANGVQSVVSGVHETGTAAVSTVLGQ